MSAPASSPLAPIWRSFRETVATFAATLATFACTAAMDAETGPLVLAVVLSLSLSRSQLDRDVRGRLEALVALPVVALAAMGVGHLLRALPLAGAAAFVLGIAASIWLRRFGPMARRAGALIALPFVALLTTPYVAPRHVSPLLAMLVPVIVALLALAFVSAAHLVGRRLGWLPPSAPTSNDHGEAPDTASVREPAPRFAASDRMAIQMAVALTLAFAVGFAVFRAHWSWVVLTAFIVNSGNRGRGDVAYKSLLRLAGAGAGTLLALLLDRHLGEGTETRVALILLTVFLGTWLRPLGYAWWALFVTLALALLQALAGSDALQLLETRLLAIAVGAAIGVAAAWLVLPVRSTAVLRRRLADALAALAHALDPANPAPSPQAFLDGVARVEQLAPALRAGRRLRQHLHESRRTLEPADWIDALQRCAPLAARLISDGPPPPGLRRQLGETRRALRQPPQILAALQALAHALAAKGTGGVTRQ